VDKSVTRAFYDIELDARSREIKGFSLTVLTAVRDTKELPAAKRLGNVDHIAYYFNYEISDYGKVDRFDVPKEVASIMKRY